MARVKRDRPGNNPLRQSFVERVRTGNVVPILSNEMMADLVMCGRAQFTEGYAKYIEYPLTERSDLLRIAKFKAITEDLEDYDLKFDFLNFVKNHFCDIAEAEGINPEKLDEVAEEMDSLPVSDFAGRLGYPKFPGGDVDSLLILANLPLPVYLTTSPHTFIEAALERAGKSPITDYCRWHPGLTEQVLNYKPTSGQPLVFHLFGLDSNPSSLLLTEDDYLQFLVAVSQGNGKSTDPIPDLIRKSMSASAPVLLGFELAGWAFRVLFWGLIKPTTMKHRGVCCLQVEPNEVERQFLQEYLKREADFEVFWGDVQEYTQELNRLYRS